MKIVRNGIEIELTPEELRKAYEEQRKLCVFDDIENYLNEDPEKLDALENHLETAYKVFERSISHDDMFWEAWWNNIDYAITRTMEYIKEETNVQ